MHSLRTACDGNTDSCYISKFVLLSSTPHNSAEERARRSFRSYIGMQLCYCAPNHIFRYCCCMGSARWQKPQVWQGFSYRHTVPMKLSSEFGCVGITSDKDREVILKLHNEYRANLTKGATVGKNKRKLPTAKNMYEVVRNTLYKYTLKA